MPFSPNREKTGGKKKGSLNIKTRLKQKIGLNHWNELAELVEGDGVKRLIQEMDGLSGRDYAIAFSTLLEFVKPKLSRSEVKSDIQSNAVVWNITKTYEVDQEAESGT